MELSDALTILARSRDSHRNRIDEYVQSAARMRERAKDPAHKFLAHVTGEQLADQYEQQAERARRYAEAYTTILEHLTETTHAPA